MAEELIGTVSDYFARIEVIGIELVGTLKVGDTIHVQGHTTDLEEVVESIQIEHEQVQEANAGDAVGIKVKDRCRKGDKVYKVT